MTMMPTNRILIIVALIALLLGACARTEIATEEPTAENAVPALTGRITFAGSTTVQPLAGELGDLFMAAHPQVQLEIAAGGSGVGIQAVKDGTADIGMASRAIKPEEEEGVTQYQIAVDVLALVVHPDNPVRNLSRDQIQGIYLGTITNWSEVGGPELTIEPVIREVTSGTRGAFDEIALDDQEPTGPNIITAITAGDVAAIVADNPAAIGYLGFGNFEEDIEIVSVDGVAPSPESANDGSYPLKRPLLLLTGSLTQPLAMEFINFAISAEGQAAVAELGWIPAR